MFNEILYSLYIIIFVEKSSIPSLKEGIKAEDLLSFLRNGYDYQESDGYDYKESEDQKHSKSILSLDESIPSAEKVTHGLEGTLILMNSKLY